MSAEDRRPGWFGKLPAIGDFAMRRVQADFVETWDAWLADSLSDWQAREPQEWLSSYLTGPVWRFVLMPGTLAQRDTAMGGVLMPSVDRVGRYFPLTIVSPLMRLPADMQELAQLLAWLHRMDDVAVDALQEDWSVDQLELELASPRCSLPAWDAAAAARPALLGADQLGVPPPNVDRQVGEMPADMTLPAWLALAAWPRLLAGLHGQTWWLSETQDGRRSLRVHRGLPVGADFSALFQTSTSPSPSSP